MSKIGGWCVVILVGFCFIVLVKSCEQKQNNSIKKQGVVAFATKEIPLETVPVKGEAVFEAKMEITYKDGKPDSVTLVPGSTKKK